MILLIVFISIPLIEIAVMIKVGQWLGFWPALGLVIATGVGGAMILARSGLASALRVQDAMLRGEPPVAAMIDSALVVMAGVLLITPGFIADLIGLALLLPFVRGWGTTWAMRNMVVMGGAQVGGRRFKHPGNGEFQGTEPEVGGNGGPRSEPGGGPVIDGEFERLDERPIDPDRRRTGDDPPPRG